METMREQGKTEAEITKKMADNEVFMKIYESNPIVMFGLLYWRFFRWAWL